MDCDCANFVGRSTPAAPNANRLGRRLKGVGSRFRHRASSKFPSLLSAKSTPDPLRLQTNKLLSRLFLWGLLPCALLSFAGCKPEAKASTPAPAEVSYVLPIERKYTEFEVFTGRVQAIDTVEIKARVTGYVDKVLFTDGQDIGVNQPLYRIDSRPYKAEAARTAALISQYKAQVQRLEHQYDRAKKLVGSHAVSEEEVEVLQYQRDEAEASQRAAEAANKAAELNVEYSEIKAPIAGRSGNHLVDAGNLVKADDTLLVKIVSVDPIYAYFDVDERTMLKIRRHDSEQSIKEHLLGLKVHFATADEQTKFPIEGEIDFVDNQIDPGTGTLRLRAKIHNPKPQLTPGNFVRCRFPVGDEQAGLFVPETALGSDQGQPFIFVINDKDEVVYRRVDVGPLEGKLRAIQSSLSVGERVIVSGLQRVKAGTKVAAKLYVEEKPADAKPTGKASEPSGEKAKDKKDNTTDKPADKKSDQADDKTKPPTPDAKAEPPAEPPPVHVLDGGKPAS